MYLLYCIFFLKNIRKRILFLILKKFSSERGERVGLVFDQTMKSLVKKRVLLDFLIDKLVDLILRANTRPWTPSVFKRTLFERGARNPYLRKADATLLV